MGQEESQTHNFLCRGCDEKIILRMNVDYKNIATEIVGVENCEIIDEVVGAPIVNLDANFLVPPAERGVDMTFPRLAQMHKMIEQAEKLGTFVDPTTINPQSINSRPFRRPDFAAEWRLLKKSWSLNRNGRQKLSQQRVERASAELYADDPLNDLPDWLWRFSLFLTQPAYEPIFRDVIDAIKPLWSSDLMPAFKEAYEKTMAPQRGAQYFTIMSEFFANYDEFAQVYFLVVKGIPLEEDFHTTSADFDSVKMFYGNAFEQFADLVEYIAMLNNMLSGRTYDAFAQLTLAEYRKLDKAGRFSTFALNQPLTNLCREANNQIRNASHHGGFSFDERTQIIRYRSGKGGTGPEQQMMYATYLKRCVEITLQIFTLFRIEIIICNRLRTKYPL